MTKKRSASGLLIPMVLLLVGAYFTFSAVQGNYGLFHRIQVEAEVASLTEELAMLREETAEMEILTRRMSDEYLDLDLLDEQARTVLGYMRADEIVLP
ncbi:MULTISPECIES: FtsB family cell division protein [Paracoccaceae]|jgi:cell division protein FtsB|uniref:Septum formation initiator family protein n=1 Tax=Rhodophyticola porphyridii TaxID=1852017 RepID=A0A3L9XZR1_9RHOB|nr:MULTISPECIES: septum formation initiator family protein [Paracoccaceae]MBO6603418.1 septum formation initiator family protein [Roseicyclus sp.]MBO6623879.1 septum formation initiator family protein [Roseicyclus sp.]MBO6921105.1 septum formation initiator family protein [Roseicyclus sp.]RMA42101.1 septum formation initiator family protein [Rhodophyticola porphyridii]